MLERLNARERAVFILKEAFSYSHEEIGKLFAIAPGNSRKILSRAKEKLQAQKKYLNKPKKMSTSFFEKYLDVIGRVDLDALKIMLSNDVSLTADGGGKIHVAQEVTVGSLATADLILFVYQNYQQHVKVSYREVNHQPSLCYSKDGKIVICQVFSLSASSRQINAIYSVVDQKNSIIRRS